MQMNEEDSALASKTNGATTVSYHSSSNDSLNNSSEHHVPSSYQQQQQTQDHQEYECLSIRSESLPLDAQQQEPQTTKICGRLLLALVAFIYGTLNVTLRLVYALPGPPSASALSCTRGWLAVLCFLPMLKLQQHTTTSSSIQTLPARPLFIMALELAIWNFGAQGLVNIGLESVPSARAAFFTQTSVVMTPVVSRIAGHAVHVTAWIGCVIALVGLFILSDNNGFGHFGVGDVLCLLGALCWSMYIFRLSTCQAYDEISLQAVKNVLLASLYTVWFVIASIQSDVSLWLGYRNPTAWLLLFYSALGPGSVADVLQQKGQAVISAAEGNVILSMEPVFTALLGLVLLGEALSWQEIVGGGLIITAAIVATQ